MYYFYNLILKNGTKYLFCLRQAIPANLKCDDFGTKNRYTLTNFIKNNLIFNMDHKTIYYLEYYNNISIKPRNKFS